MSGTIHDWKRFWYPRDRTIKLSDGGYLLDPESEFGRIYNPSLVTLDDMSSVPCLVLLGELGMGKSTALRAHFECIKNRITPKGDSSIFFNLGACGNASDLREGLFGTPRFRSWLDGTQRLYLFLDSLDECMMRMGHVVTILSDGVQEWPVERLHLRIACRTASWPPSLEEAFQRRWKPDHVRVVELAPLRQVDVVQAARENGVGCKAFLAAVHSAQAVPLAIKPMTLQFLLNRFSRRDRLTTAQAELYQEGCRSLCEETEPRRDSGLSGRYSSEQRMIVAARIAAVTVFSDKTAVWTGLDRGNVPDTDVTVRQLSGGRESSSGSEVEVKEECVREALNTGLFSSRGSNRLGFSHQSYADFLAAWYLVHRRVPVRQLLSLLTHPGDPQGRLPPQLHETAAWLASMMPDLSKILAKREPELLIRSTAEVPRPDDRASVVDALLGLYDQGSLALDYHPSVWRGLAKLAHPTLADQLRGYLIDRTKSETARQAAALISDICEVSGLQDDLVEVALDPGEPLPVRMHCALAICRTGDDEAKARLLPLAAGTAGDDPDDELKGCGLRAIWPNCVSAKELFSLVTPPKRQAFLGQYWSFLMYELATHLKPGDLPHALEWVARGPWKDDLERAFPELVGQIMLRAWEESDHPGVPEALAQTCLARIQGHKDVIPFSSEERARHVFAEDDRRRRLLLAAIMAKLPRSGMRATSLVRSSPQLVLSKDLAWPVDRLKSEESPQTQSALVQLIGRVFDCRDASHAEVIYGVKGLNRELDEAFTSLLAPVRLDSPEAERMKQVYLDQYETVKEEPTPRPMAAPPAELIVQLLDLCESGDPTAWCDLMRVMAYEADSDRHDSASILVRDLTAFPGWRNADGATRERIVNCAWRYLHVLKPDTTGEPDSRSLSGEHVAGYQAMRLVLKEAPGLLRPEERDTWQTWIPIITRYVWIASEETSVDPLMREAYSRFPDDVIQALQDLIDCENSRRDPTLSIWKFECYRDERLAEAVLKKAKDPSLSAECVGSLLESMLRQEYPEAREFAASLVPSPPPEGDERARSIAAARALVKCCSDMGWPVVWPAIQQDVEWGREVLSHVAREKFHIIDTVGSSLTEGQLADLFIWLERHYPHHEDRAHFDAHSIGTREAVARLRDSLLERLKRRGTPEACAQVARIARELPTLQWIPRVLQEAQRVARYRTWVPHRVEDLVILVNHPNKRLVRNGEELLDVLVESLQRLQHKLMGETPRCVFLWDEIPSSVPNETADRPGDELRPSPRPDPTKIDDLLKTATKKAYRPKDEPRLSDYVKGHLQDDVVDKGIVVNREVEIRPSTGQKRGQRTDIHVDVSVQEPCEARFAPVTAIIEVKGCWNRELFSAMKTQLVDRYLKENQCQHGLYVVGWFNCDQWDDRDRRKGKSPKLSVAETQEKLDKQAAELSQDSLLVKAVVLDCALG